MAAGTLFREDVQRPNQKRGNPMNLTQMKNTVLAVLAAAGSAVAQALGGWDVALKVLICFMALDYVTGWLVAAVWHKSAKSKTGALASQASY